MKKHTAKERTLFLTRAAAIAALYVILTLISSLFGLDKNAIQVRFSEALCVLPIFTSAAVPGVTIGCFLYNLLFASPLDAIFGTLATLIGVLGARYLPYIKNNVYLVSIPTVISNAVIIPFVIAYAYMDGNVASIPFSMLTVAIGEIIACSILGTALLFAIKKHRLAIFGNDSNMK